MGMYVCCELKSPGEEDEFIDVETVDVDNMLNIFDEITAELLKEGEMSYT